MKKRILTFAIATVMTLSLAACGGKVENDTPTTPDEPTTATTPDQAAKVNSGEKLTIGISVNSTSNEHNQQVFETSIANGEARGHEVISTNAGGVAAQQATDI